MEPIRLYRIKSFISSIYLRIGILFKTIYSDIILFQDE